MVTIQDIRRRKDEVRRSLRGDRGSSARQKQDTLRQLEQAERILERKGSQSAVNNILSNISKKAIFGGRQQIQRSTQNAQPNKPTIVRDSSGRVIQASSSVKARVPNIIGKRISTRQSQLITGGIVGTISKKQAQVAIQQQRRIAKRESTKTRDFIDKNRELSQFIDKVNKRIQQENKNREIAQQKQKQFLQELNTIPIQTLAKQKGKTQAQIQKDIKDRLTFFNRKEVKQAQTASRDISEFTENFERLFKKIPGLRSERFFSKVGRDILAAPSRQTVGFALEISQGAKNIRQLQKDTKSNNPVIREQAKKQLKAITKSLPKQVIQGLDPRTPDGFANLVLMSTAVLSPLALRRIIKAKTPKSGSIEALDNTNTVVIDSTTKKASIIDKNGKVIAISNKPVNINLFRKLRDNVRSTQTYQKILAKEQKNLARANKAAQKLGFKDAQERILFDKLEKSAKSSNKAKKKLTNLENNIIKRNVDKKISSLDKRIQKQLPKKQIKVPKNKINDQTNKIFDKLEKSLENIRKKEEVKLKKDNKAAQKLGFKDSSEYITYQNALTKARNGSKIALAKVKLIERRVVKRKAKLLQEKNKKPTVLSQRRIKKLIKSKGLDVKIKAPKSRKINKKERKTIENIPSLKQLEATFDKGVIKKVVNGKIVTIKRPSNTLQKYIQSLPSTLQSKFTVNEALAKKKYLEELSKYQIESRKILRQQQRSLKEVKNILNDSDIEKGKQIQRILSKKLANSPDVLLSFRQLIDKIDSLDRKISKDLSRKLKKRQPIKNIFGKKSRLKAQFKKQKQTERKNILKDIKETEIILDNLNQKVKQLANEKKPAFARLSRRKSIKRKEGKLQRKNILKSIKVIDNFINKIEKDIVKNNKVLKQKNIKNILSDTDLKIGFKKQKRLSKKLANSKKAFNAAKAFFIERDIRSSNISKKISKPSSNEVIIETKKGIYKLNLSTGKREIFVKKNVGNGKTQQVVLQKVESKVIQKPKTKRKTKAKVKKIVERATLAKSLPSIKQVFVLFPGYKILSVNRYAQISNLGQDQKIKPILIIQQNNALTPKQKQQINTIFKNINIQDIRYTTDSITRLQKKLRTPVKTTKIKTKIKIIPKKPKLPQLPKPKVSKTKRQKINSYDVYILKNRKYIRVNNGSLTKSAAQSLLDNVLDKSVGASGYIKGSKARPNILARKLPYISQRKFRKPKAKSKLKRVSKVEKSKNRIDTRGEKRGLSAAKVAKRLLKNANKKRRTKKSRAKKRK